MPVSRSEMFGRFRSRAGSWDMVVIGGGATGVGVAVDAASRGYAVLLLEQSDFGKGTSSRSTKLAHGGVRYLQQGNVALVAEALRERKLLLDNAPHLVSRLGFVVPGYRLWDKPYYGIGLKLYGLLAGKYGFGRTRVLSRKETLACLPSVRFEGLRGGVLYFDGQFDDARLLINLVQTASEHGAALLNYAPVTGFARDAQGLVDGVIFRDAETGGEFEARARIVINAAGPFADAVRIKADPSATPIVAPSQGVHLVLDRSFLPSETALMIPRTPDGRVMFAIPWQDHTLLGTTDTPLDSVSLEPVALEREIEFILATASSYLARKPERADVLSVFAGIRPLARSGASGRTAELSRDYAVRLEASGLLTIYGGKWTTYRRMSEDCVNQAARRAGLPARPCVTRTLAIHGACGADPLVCAGPPGPASDLAAGPQEQARGPAAGPGVRSTGPLSHYGTDAPAVRQLIEHDPALAESLHPALPYTGAEIVWAARSEMARTVEDALARRTRALFLNARAATAMAPRVAALMARELGHGAEWELDQTQAFLKIAQGYLA
jgi:glycerol-3-phosphate dehydrogenase